jgi:hypothetical protein
MRAALSASKSYDQSVCLKTANSSDHYLASLKAAFGRPMSSVAQLSMSTIQDFPLEESLDMAHYDAVLRQAVEDLPDPSPVAREALYERTKTALISLLQSAKQPIPFEFELRALEQAIDRLEARIKETTQNMLATARTNGMSSNLQTPDDTSQDASPALTAEEATRSGGWLSDLLTRASRDNVSHHGLLALGSARSDNWLDDLLTRSLTRDMSETDNAPKTDGVFETNDAHKTDDVLETDTAPEASSDLFLRSPVLKMLEGAISKEIQLAALEDDPVGALPDAVPAPAEGEGWARRRKLLLTPWSLLRRKSTSSTKGTTLSIATEEPSQQNAEEAWQSTPAFNEDGY